MEKLDFASVTLVLKMKEIVILMISVRMVLYVDQIIAQIHLALILILIVVSNHLLEVKTFVCQIFVDMIKGIMILIVNALVTIFVAQTTAWLHWVLTMELTAAVVLK